MCYKINFDPKLHLKNCPFCGSSDVLLHVRVIDEQNKKFYSVFCEDCPGEVSDLHTKEEAIEVWNRRNCNEKT